VGGLCKKLIQQDEAFGREPLYAAAEEANADGQVAVRAKLSGKRTVGGLHSEEL